MVSYEQICSQNMQKKIEEVEFQLKDMHQKELRSVSERIEHFYKSNYIDIKEHEAILQDQLAKEAQLNQNFIEDLKRQKEAEAVQLQTDL